MTGSLLHNTTICAIMGRLKSPAGTVEDFIHSHIPHVDEGIIVANGNYELYERLIDMQASYPNLSVISREFDGFANLRNAGLRKVKTDWVLVLDDDELLLHEDFVRLNDYLENNDGQIGYTLPWIEIDWNGHEKRSIAAVNPRLFKKSKNPLRKTRYRKAVYEDLFLGNTPMVDIMRANLEIDVEIKHFRPHHTAGYRKSGQLYSPLQSANYPDSKFLRFLKGCWKIDKPVTEEQSWNELNPHRLQYQSN